MSDSSIAVQLQKLIPVFAQLDYIPEALTFSGINPRAHTRRDQTIEAIKGYIISNGLQSGDPLPTELDLVQELGTSRSSVREAMRKLEALHIVKVVHGRGTFVGDMSINPMIETLSFRALTNPNDNLGTLQNVISFRRAIDLGIAEVVMEKLQGTKPKKLLDLVKSMKEYATAEKSFLGQDIDFHTQILQEAGNEVLLQVARSLWLVHMTTLPLLSLEVTSELSATADAHEDILDAIIAGDLLAYREAVKEHYRPIVSIVQDNLAD